jgi:uncharacterized membrane protein affecting hemolysin expression
MKKYITSDNMFLATSAALILSLLASLLVVAIASQQKWFDTNHELQNDVQTMFDSLEKPLVIDGMFLDDSNS